MTIVLPDTVKVNTA